MVALVLAGGAGARGRASTSVFEGQWQTTRGVMYLRSQGTLIDWGAYGDTQIGRLCGVHSFASDSPSTLVLGGIWYEGGDSYIPTSDIECGSHKSSPWGRFYFRISADGKSFTGGFTTAGDGLPLGNTSRWPAWNGTKAGSSSGGTSTLPAPTPAAPSGPAAPSSPSGAAAPTVGHRYKLTASGQASGTAVAARALTIGSGTYRVTSVSTRLGAAFTYAGRSATGQPKGTWDVTFTLGKTAGSGPPTTYVAATYHLTSGRPAGSGFNFTFGAKLLGSSPKLPPPCAPATLIVTPTHLGVRTCLANANVPAKISFR